MQITAVDVADVPGHITVGDLYTPTGLHKNVTHIVYEHAYPEGDLIFTLTMVARPVFQNWYASTPLPLNSLMSLILRSLVPIP